MRLAPLVLVLASLSACSLSIPDEDEAFNVLTDQFFRASNEVPSFGGLLLEDGIPIVYTLGPDPAATPVVESIFDVNVEVRERPRRGNGSEALKGRATRLLLGRVLNVQSTDYDETTGYVRIGALTAGAVRTAYQVLERTGYPMEVVLLEVQGQIVLDIL